MFALVNGLGKSELLTSDLQETTASKVRCITCPELITGGIADRISTAAIFKPYSACRYSGRCKSVDGLLHSRGVSKDDSKMVAANNYLIGRV